MILILKICLIFILLVPFINASPNQKNKGTTVDIKPGGAVTAFSEEDGFKLSEKAVENLNVRFTTISGPGPWTLPKEAILNIKLSTGVYRKWDNWITMVLVKIKSRSKNTVTVESQDLQDLDQVAIEGVAYLRMTEADLNSDTVDVCSH